MKRQIIIALILISTSLNCYTQNNWKPGYIIKNSRDTVYGLIDNRDSRSNSKQCFFLTEELVEKEKFSPNDILGYRFIDGKFFISKTVQKVDSTQKIFLEFILNGEADIFHYKDDKDYYFIEKEGEMYELKNTITYKKVNYRDYQHEKKEYIGILNTLMQDAEMQSEIYNTSLATKSLIDIAKKYHDRVCFDEQCIIYEKKSGIHVKWGVHFGTSLNSFNFADKFNTNYGLSNSIGCRVKFENVLVWAENISFSTEFSLQEFSKYKLTQNNLSSLISYNNQYYLLKSNDENKNNLDVNLKVVALKIPLTINYTFSHGKVRPYINLGISNTFILSQNKDFVYHSYYNFFDSSIPKNLVVGFVGRVGSELMINDKHSIYTDIALDYTQNAQTGEMIFTNKMYSFTLGYNF